MKIVLLQLSDLHISSEKSFNSIYVNQIIDVLSTHKCIDAISILLTGDLAYAGKKSQYDLLDIYLNKFIDLLNEKFKLKRKIDFLIVPGNHDIDFSNGYRNREDIRKMIEELTDEKIEKELKMQEDFFDFANKYKCFLNNKITDTIYIDYSNVKIRFNLLNSAIFSGRSDNGDNELGLHIFPQKYIDNFNQHKEHAEIEIALIHHSINWFSEDSRERLIKEFQQNSSLVFLGHEHNHHIEKTIKDTYEISYVIMGGAYTSSNQSFCLSLLDTEKKQNDIYEYKYNPAGNIYVESRHYSEKYEVNKRKNQFRLNDDFLKILRNDEKNGLGTSFEEYFILPEIKISPVDDLEKSEVESMNQLMDVISKKQLITVTGGSLSGKTTILKKIFLELIQTDYIPIYLNAHDMKDRSIDWVIKHFLKQQYVEKSWLIDKYMQLDKEKKIILIDDAHMITSDYCKVINELTKNFGKVIVTSSKEFNFDIKEQIDEMLSSIVQVNASIQTLHYQKRSELIEKVFLSINGEGYEPNKDEIKKINDMISQQIGIMFANPYTVISIAKHFREFTASETSTKGIFSKVFEMNITKMLLKSIQKNKIDSIFIILEEIAYLIHFTKKYPIDEDDISRIVKKYNDEYLKGFSQSETIQNLISCGVIRNDGHGKLLFFDKNVLAYFVARSLLRKVEDEDIETKLNYVLKNVCFGINSTILLFISYFSFNNKVLEHIILDTMEKYDKWDEFAYNDDSISFLNTKHTNKKLFAPTQRDYDNRDIDKDNSEKRDDELKFEVEDLYSYNEAESEDFQNQIVSAFKTLEIISQILPSFEHRMKKDIKNAYIEILYTFPNRLFNQVYKLMVENYDEFIESVVKEHNESYEKVDSSIRNALNNMLLRIYYYVGNRIATDETIIALNMFDYSKNTNYAIENLIMQSKIKKDSVFFEKAEKIYDDTSSLFLKSIYSRIVNSYFVEHKLPTINANQRVVSKFFEASKTRTIKKIAFGKRK